MREINDLFKASAKLKLHDANEAETRKKLIDKIIEDLLGWNDDDISYEERVSEDGKTTYADYIIRTADISILIEAKRIGKTFVIIQRDFIGVSTTIIDQAIYL